MNQTGFLDFNTTGTHQQQVEASLEGLAEIKSLMDATAEVLSSADSLNPQLGELNTTLVSSSELIGRVLDPEDRVSAESMASLSGFYSTVERLLSASDIVMSNGESLAAYLKAQQSLTKAQLLQSGVLSSTLDKLGTKVEGTFEDFTVRNATEISTKSLAGDVVRATATSLAGPLAPIVPMLDSLINIDKMSDSLSGKVVGAFKSLGEGTKTIVGDTVRPKGGFIDRKLEEYKIKSENKRRIKLERKAQKREKKADIRRAKELSRRMGALGLEFDAKAWLASKESKRIEKYRKVASDRENELQTTKETGIADLIGEANSYVIPAKQGGESPQPQGTKAQPQDTEPQPQRTKAQDTEAQPQGTKPQRTKPHSEESPLDSFIADTLSSMNKEVDVKSGSNGSIDAQPKGSVVGNKEGVVGAITGKDGIVDTLLDIQKGDYDFFDKQFDELKKSNSSSSNLLGGSALTGLGTALAGIKNLLGRVLPQGTKPQGTKPQGTKPQGTKPQGTKPQGTKPQPQGTKPQGTKPQGTKPKLGKFAKGAGLLGLATGAYSIYRDATDETKTTSEKEVAVSGDVGGMAGAAAGAWSGGATGAAIGTLILPGIGTAIGGFLGSLMGGTAGYMAGSTIAEGGARMVVGESKSNDLEPQKAQETTVVVPPPVVHVEAPKQQKQSDNVNTTAIPMRHDELGAAILNGGVM